MHPGPSLAGCLNFEEPKESQLLPDFAERCRNRVVESSGSSGLVVEVVDEDSGRFLVRDPVRPVRRYRRTNFRPTDRLEVGDNLNKKN